MKRIIVLALAFLVLQVFVASAADLKISALPTATSIATADITAIVTGMGSTPITKKITVANMFASFAADNDTSDNASITNKFITPAGLHYLMQHLTTITASGLGTFGTLSAGAGGFFVDADGNVIGKSYTVTKVNNIASSICWHNDNGTQTYGWCEEGPHAATAWANSITEVKPSTEPTYGQVLVAGTPVGHKFSWSWANPGATKTVTQSTHGFAVGDVLYLNSGTYTKAVASSAAAAEVVGIVSAVPTASTFTMTSVGYVSGLTGLTAGTLYYLSPSSAGTLTATQPSTVGQVIKPVFIADSTTSGYFYNMRGAMVSAGLTLADIPKPAYHDDNATATVCSGYYKSDTKLHFTAPPYSAGCQMCVRQASNKTNVIRILPYDSSQVFEPSAKTALCSANQELKDSGTAAATDMICIVGSDTANTWDTWSVSGTWTCAAQD
jgi:hypothetical protein